MFRERPRNCLPSGDLGLITLPFVVELPRAHIRQLDLLTQEYPNALINFIEGQKFNRFTFGNTERGYRIYYRLEERAIRFGFFHKGGRVPEQAWLVLGMTELRRLSENAFASLEGSPPEGLARVIGAYPWREHRQERLVRQKETLTHIRELDRLHRAHEDRKKKKRREERERQRSVSRNNKCVFLDYEEQSDSIFDEGYIPLEDEDRDVGAFSAKSHFFAAKKFRQGLAFTQDTLTRVVLGKLTEAFSFYQSYVSAFSIYRETGIKAHIRLHDLKRAGLQFLRAMMGRQSILTTVEGCLGTFLSMIFGNHDGLMYENQGVFDHDDVNLPLLFLASVPFMGSQDKSRSKFENALYNYKKTGGIVDKSKVAHSLFHFIGWLMEVGTQAFEQKSLRPFYHNAESYRTWYLTSRDIVGKKNLMVLNHTDAEFSDYLKAVHNAIDKGEQILARHASDPRRSPTHATATRLVDELRAILRDREIRELARTTKRPPFYLGLYGPPGIGKTVILDEIFAFYSALRGEKYDKSRKFSMNASDKFASGLRSDHKYFVLDDIGSINRDVDGPSAAAFIRLFMEFANVTAPATNQAALEDKGTIFARPEVVIATTNDRDYGTKGVATYPQAFFRRLRYSLILSVKTEYRNRPETNQISAVKAAVSNTRDLHEFTVVEYVLVARGRGSGVESDMPSIQEVVVLDKVDDLTFFAWLRVVLEEHIRVNVRLKEVDDELETAFLCEACGLLSVRCRCTQAPQLRVFEDFASDKVVVGEVVVSSPSTPLLFQPQGTCASNPRKAVRSMASAFAAWGHSLVNWGSFAREAWKLYHIEYGCVLELRKLMAAFITLHLVRGQDQVPIAAIYPPNPSWDESALPMVQPTSMRPTKVLRYQDQGLSISAMHTLLKEMDKGAPRDAYRQQARGGLELTRAAQNVPFQNAVNRVRRNLVQVEVSCGAETVRNCALGLSGPWLMTVGHAFKGSGPWRVVIDDPNAHQDVVVTKIYPTGYYDLVVFTTPRFYKDITVFFPTSMGVVENFDVLPILARGTGESLLPAVLRVQPQDAPGGAIPGLYVPFASQAGDCGAPYVAQIGKHLAIVGIHRHFVSDTTTGARAALACPLTHGSPLGSMEVALALMREPLRLALDKNGLGQCPNRKWQAGYFHAKSYVRFRLGGLEGFPEHFRPLGTIEYGVPRMGTRLEPTPLNGLVPPTDKLIPQLRPGTYGGEYVNHFNTRVDLMCDNQAHIPENLLSEAADRVLSRFLRVFDEVPHLKPLSDLEALNGLDGVRFVDGLKMQTGKGLPERGPKTDLFVRIGDQWQFTEKGTRSTAYILDHLAKGENPGIIGDFVLKDEPVKVGKAARVFTPFPAPFNHIMRRVFLLVFKVIQENSDVLGIAIGVNARSSEWADRYHRHMRFPHHVLYDFKNFDLSHSKEALYHAHRVLMVCANRLYGRWGNVGGYPWALIAARGLALVGSPVYNVLNTIIQAQGSLGSGLWETAIINSVIQLIILESLWISYWRSKEEGPVPPFEQHNTVDTYGDDGFVSTRHEGFNLRFFIQTAQQWNLIITDPDKYEIPRLVFPVHEWSFLKRGFVYKAELEVWAPLDIKSVYKLLNLWEVPTDLPIMDAVIRRCGEAAEHLAYIETEEARALEAAMHQALCILYGARSEGSYFPLRQSILDKYARDFYPTYAHWNVVRRRFPTKTLTDGISVWYTWKP